MGYFSSSKETNKQLLERYILVQQELADTLKRMKRAKLGSAKRSSIARFTGCLTFTLLGIEYELIDRGLLGETDRVSIRA